jgi:hypothetical protein
LMALRVRGALSINLHYCRHIVDERPIHQE